MRRSADPAAQADPPLAPAQPRLLLVGNARPNSGLGRVLDSLAEHWHPTFEVVQFGIDTERVLTERAWQVLPNRKHADPLGVAQLPELLARLQPDLVFMCHDPWLFKAHRDALLGHGRSKVVFYCPIDSPPHAPEDLAHLADLDRLICYTHYGRQMVHDAFSALRVTGAPLRTPPLAVLPHGVDAGRFHPLHGPPSEASLRRSRVAARAQLAPARACFTTGPGRTGRTTYASLPAHLAQLGRHISRRAWRR